MNSIKNIIGFSVYSSVWVAIAVYSLTRITYLNLDIPVDDTLLFFVFFGTIPAYNFVKNFEKRQLTAINFRVSGFGYQLFVDMFKQLALPKKLMFLLSLFCVLISALCFIKLQYATQLFLLTPFLLTVFYTVSFGTKTLRTIAGLKIYIIAICWTLITVVLPIIEYGMFFTDDFYVEIVQRFLFVIAITLPFEIRDLKLDKESLATIPQKIGVKRTKLLGGILLIFFFFLEFLKDELLERNLIVLLIVFIISLLLLLLAKKKQSKYYAGFFVEGIPILWLVLLMIL